MALTIVGVQGARQPLAQGYQDSFLLIPGTSDYVTGGYVISTILTGFSKIQAAWFSGANATAVAATAVNYPIPIFVLAEVGTGGPGFTGYSQFLWKLIVSSTGAEAASGFNFTGAIWQVTIQGY